MLLLCSAPRSAYPQVSPIIPAQTKIETEQLFSSSVARKLYEIAYEIANLDSKKDIDGPTAEQAIIFLNAATNLDRRATYVQTDIIKLLCHPTLPITDSNDSSASAQQERFELISRLLANYVNKDSDLEVAKLAIRYMLDQLDSREQRENLLKYLGKSVGEQNALLGSELSTLLGLLAAEKADLETAKAFFLYAYSSNKYNKIAVEKIIELAPEQLAPAAYLEHLRLVLVENPLSLQASLAFAQYVDKLELYQTAADAYEYAVQAFRYLYPAEPLPDYIYLPWALSNYNTLRNQHKCLQIASEFRQAGRFDLALETIAAKAAQKIGNIEQANLIFQYAEKKALENYQTQSDNRILQTQNCQSLAWFYSFALHRADEAINWANKAYSLDPNSATTASLLAYALVMNQQTNWAQTLIDNYQPSQIADLAQAQIMLAQDQNDSAIESLKATIAKDPGSLTAEKAKDILQQLGSQYIPSTDPYIIMMELTNTVGQKLVPQFTRPQNIISAELSVRGSKFSYGSEFNGVVAITNNSSEPLVINDDGLLKGGIRIDAAVSGDINQKIPNLVSVNIRPASPVEPGQTLFIPVRLVTAELRQIMLTYPQASMDIEFTVYLDPVITDQGQTRNRLTDIKPVKLSIKRTGIELTDTYIQNRLNTLGSGKQGQKIKIAQLFTGLLSEQNAMANHQPPYKMMHADWMPNVIKNALAHTLADDDWVVKANTMAAMISLPLDYELITALADNLNDSHWPVRLIAVYLLAKSPNNNFAKVLDWAAKYDTNQLVRDMAIALGAARPPVQKQVIQQPPDKEQNITPTPIEQQNQL
jgi:hypothetical protein